MINDNVIAFVPHAQERKNEIWIMPRRQCHSFALASGDEVRSLALAARSCLGMLYAAFDDPDYNILMRSAPSRDIDAPGDSETEPIAEWYRWHLVIIPHDGEWGGIKGYGGFTPTAGTPEQHAAEMRQYRGEVLTEAQRLEAGPSATAAADVAVAKVAPTAVTKEVDARPMTPAAATATATDGA